MRLKKNIAVSETGFLFDPNTGESFNLNKTGQFIVQQLAKTKNEHEIIEAVLETYDIETNTLHRYFDDFVMMLRQFGLIEVEEA